VWFVMVKDAKGRFAPATRLWEDGWGWALFKADAPAKERGGQLRRPTAWAAMCRQPSTDRVFIQGYPTLKPH
jgi:hypothetical protein